MKFLHKLWEFLISDSESDIEQKSFILSIIKKFFVKKEMALLDKHSPERMRKKFIRRFLDLLTLVELRKGYPKSGYDMIALIHRKFDVLLSSGTVYSTLYRLERNGLISGKWIKKRRTYMLTENGKRAIEDIMNDYEKIKEIVADLSNQKTLPNMGKN